MYEVFIFTVGCNNPPIKALVHKGNNIQVAIKHANQWNQATIFRNGENIGYKRNE